MWSKSRDNKYTCVYPSPWSSSPCSAHKMTWILVLYSILYVYATFELLVLLTSRIHLSVLLVICSRHFPLRYEGVKRRTIEVLRRARGIYEMILKLFLARLDRFQMKFSSWLDFTHTLPYTGTTKIDMGNRTFAPY